MDTLTEKLHLSERRGEILDACCRLLDEEVRKKKGVGGLIVKASYKALKAFSSGAVRQTIDALLDEFLHALEPLHVDFQKGSGTGSFGSFMKTRVAPIAEALVGVTDRRAERTKHKSLKGAYRKLRPSAVRHVGEAVPGLAELCKCQVGVSDPIVFFERRICGLW